MVKRGFPVAKYYSKDLMKTATYKVLVYACSYSYLATISSSFALQVRKVDCNVLIFNLLWSTNNKGLIHAIFLDFAEVFNKVPHKKLCHKLPSYDIIGAVLEWISDSVSF